MSTEWTKTRDDVKTAAEQQATAFALHAFAQGGAYLWNRYATKWFDVHPFTVAPLPTGPVATAPAPDA